MERVARSAWRGARFAWGARGNRGRLDEFLWSGSEGGECGRGSRRERLEEQAWKRDAWMGRLPRLGGRRGEEAERLEAKGERRSSVMKRRTSLGAARGVLIATRRTHGRRLHESGKRPCATGTASMGARGEALGTERAPLRRTKDALVETRDALITSCEAPSRVTEALRSVGDDSPGIPRDSERGARATTTLGQARP